MSAPTADDPNVAAAHATDPTPVPLPPEDEGAENIAQEPGA